jgi:uncharacterized protein involved in high-affinity Fe2+ transport
MTYRYPVLALGLLLSATGAAMAQTAPAADARQARPPRIVSLTFSPLHLTLPVFEATAEVRLMDKLGIAAVLGAGRVKEEATATVPATSSRVVEAGLQGRYYLLGDFRHGLQLGAEAMYVHLSDKVETISAAVNGFSAGPFLGYKYTAGFGLTFDGQIGFQRVGLAGKATDGAQTITDEQSDWSVLLNLNVGWSF